MIKELVKRILCRIKYRRCMRFGRGSWCDLSCNVQGKNKMGKDAELFHSEIGYGSYLSAYSKLQYTKIGKYCSIGKNVESVFGKHPTKDWVSTHPAFFSTRKQAGFTYTDKERFDEGITTTGSKKIIIGNDVWIGNNVLLMEGIKIGDGAIIAAGAVVTKDVAPYAIVGGVPAKLIRYRFTKEQITILLEVQWWNKSEAWIQENVAYFSNVEEFLHRNS